MNWVFKSVFFCLAISALQASITSGNVYEKHCDFAILSTRDYLDPTLIQRGDAIFVKTRIVDYFLQQILPQITVPIVLVTSNGIGTIDDKYLPYLDQGKIAHWFGINITLKHPKATIIPLGASWFGPKNWPLLNQSLESLSPILYFQEKPFQMYVNWTKSTHKKRSSLIDYFSEEAECKITSRRLSFPLYLSEVKDSRFVISPRGINIDCFRTWEALSVGSIPVVESLGIDDVYADLPVIIVPSLERVTLPFLEQEMEKLRGKEFHFEKLEAEYWIEKISAVQRSLR